MDEEPDDPSVRALLALADRLASLADTADLMGDEPNATRLRAQAARHRLQAMTLLDN